MDKTLKLILEKMDEGFGVINQKFAAMDQRFETNDRLATLEIKVDKLCEDVEEIKQVMTTKEDLEYYDQMISEHAREIYKLKNR